MFAGEQVFLPVPRARFALERANDIRGNPAAIEMAGLWRDTLAVDKAIDASRVERDAGF